MSRDASLREEILETVSSTTDILTNDVLAFTNATAESVESYNAGNIDLGEACFWHKSLVRSFLSLVEVQCCIIRTSTAAHAAQLHAPIPANKLHEIAAIDRRRSTEELATLAFRYFPLLFGISIPFDRGNENYRGFKALTDARERFTHPKDVRDVCPFELFPSTKPAIEWFLLHWQSILLRCSSTVYSVPLDPGQLSVPQLFRDSMLAAYRDRQSQVASSPPGDPVLRAIRTISFPLVADTCRAKRLVGDSTGVRPSIDTNAALRCLIRTFFSEVEGTIHMAESHLRMRHGDSRAVDKHFLAGSHEDVRETVASTVEAFSQEFGFGETVHRSGDPWDAFLVARKVRDRLTHPKKLEDLDVDSDDFAAIRLVESWWHYGDIDRCLKSNVTRL